MVCGVIRMQTALGRWRYYWLALHGCSRPINNLRLCTKRANADFPIRLFGLISYAKLLAVMSFAVAKLSWLLMITASFVAVSLTSGE